MKQWYKITAKKDSAEIFIYEQIGDDFFGDGVAARPFVSDLNKLNVKSIDLYINSPGGNVFDGNSIYNALSRHKAEINVYIDGVAASIASVIAMAGDRIFMPENTMMMIHDPSGIVMGTASDMQKMVEALDRIKVGMVAAYKTHVALDTEEISELMAAETWMTAAEAVEMGFATETMPSVKMAANFDAFKLFNNVPDHISDVNKTIMQEAKTMKITSELIQTEHPEIVAEILKGVDLDYVRKNLPEIANQIKADGIAEGAEEERTRIKAVKEQSMPGHEALIEALMFDGETGGAQAAVRILQAEKQIRAQMSADLKKDAPDMIEQPSTDIVDIVANDAHLPIDKRCEKRWENSKEIQAEFMGDFEAYLAYEKAVDGGRVKVLG